MPASPPFKFFQAIFDVDLLHGKAASNDSVPLNPAVNGFSTPYVDGEPDYIVRCAWFKGMDGQHPQQEASCRIFPSLLDR